MRMVVTAVMIVPYGIMMVAMTPGVMFASVFRADAPYEMPMHIGNGSDSGVRPGLLI